MSSAISFVGLGNMGFPMAANLAKAGFGVAGYDTVPRMREVADQNGIRVVDSLADAISGCDIVITMLPDGAVVRDVLSEAAGVAKDGALFIDCSTVDVDSARWAHEHLAQRGFRVIDAPVSGGTSGARAATLTFMCGGDAEALALAQPVLGAMGKRVVHCGPAGSGQAAKLCNNMVLGISMIAVCEAFNLADRIGLDRQAMFDVVSTSSGSCWSINTYCPAPGIGPVSPADNGYAPGFAAALMLKDLKLSQAAAAAAGAATPLGAHACAIYERFVKDGDGHKDFSAIIEALGDMIREQAA